MVFWREEVLDGICIVVRIVRVQTRQRVTQQFPLPDLRLFSCHADLAYIPCYLSLDQNLSVTRRNSKLSELSRHSVAWTGCPGPGSGTVGPGAWPWSKSPERAERHPTSTPPVPQPSP